jgi:hypothetical protein
MPTKRKPADEQNHGNSRRVVRDMEGPADWASADAGLMQEAIAKVTVRGGAIRFGYTSDGGAYSIGLYGDGDPYTDYVRPKEGINEYLRGIIESWG